MIISFDAVWTFASYSFDETLDSDGFLMLCKNIPYYTIEAVHCCSAYSKNVSHFPIMTLNHHGSSPFPLEVGVTVVILSYVIIKLFT